MLFMRNLKNCTVHTCPVANSIMGFNLNGCKISLIGHQIRLHDSEDTDFYVYTTSRLIIEDCTRLRFHELQYEYPELEHDLQEATLAKGQNLWKEVQDFKWIKKEKSPNFQLVFDGKEAAPAVEERAVMYNPVVPSAGIPGKPTKTSGGVQEGVAEAKAQGALAELLKEEAPKPKAPVATPAPKPQAAAPVPVPVAVPTPVAIAAPQPVNEDEDIDEI